MDAAAAQELDAPEDDAVCCTPPPGIGSPPPPTNTASAQRRFQAFAGAAATTATVQEELEALVCLPLQSPLIRERPRLRRSRTPVSIHSLRRSGRIAAQPRAANSTRQAQNVLLKKLGIAVDEDAVDSVIESQFKAAFCHMTERKQRALQILFNGDFDPVTLDLDMAESDIVES
jgi:hypothetical protein